jgi:hypothetical protein
MWGIDGWWFLPIDALAWFINNFDKLLEYLGRYM